MEIYSLFELNQYIKQVIALNFVESVWISCEIAQVNSSRGHCYLELVEKEELTDQIKARISGVIWFRDFSFIKKKLGKIVDQVLQEGMEVKLKVEIDYHERYGLKLVVKDIDPSYTYGQLAIQREQVIERLKKEERLNLNGLLPFPSVVQRIAVISSNTAAGFQDLREHLQSNPYSFYFQCDLFPAAMQGDRTEMEVIAALRDIVNTNQYEIVIITRGGGSKLDLAAFDSYHIAKEISEYPIPVVTGIGHDVDQSIADMVAAIALKTPTAVANFLIDHNASFESALYDIAVNIKLASQDKLAEINNGIQNFISLFEFHAKGILKNRLENIISKEHDIPFLLLEKVNRIKERLEFYEEKTLLLDPKNILKKGYSISYRNGEVIKSKNQLEKNDEIITEFFDGKVKSKVQ